MGYFKTTTECESCGGYPHQPRKIKKGTPWLAHFYKQFVFLAKDVESPCSNCGEHWCDCWVCQLKPP